MVLKAEQERVGTILKETITTMCKNSLSFSAEFSVEALIGITLDQDEVFLVSIKELVKAQQKSNEESSLLLSASDGENSSNLFDNSTTRSGRKRKRRKCRSGGKQAKRANPPDQSNSDDNEADPFDSFITEEPGAEEPMSPQPDVLKEEVQVVGQLDVKQEMDSWLDTAESTSGDQNQSLGQEQELDAKGVECVEEGVSGQQIPTVGPDGAGTSQQQGCSLWKTTQRTCWSCEECHLSFNGKDNFEHHIKSHKKLNLSCEVGSEVFKTRRPLSIHEVHHGNSKFLHCTICKKRFRSKSSLKRHEKAHSNIYKEICQFCGKGFNEKLHYLSHINVHTGSKPYPCPRGCGAFFSAYTTMKDHDKGCGVETLQHQCNMCSKSFKRFRYLKEHMKVHTEPNRYECSHCGEKFTYRGSLHKHKHHKHPQ